MTISDKKAKELAEKCLNEIYLNSEPSISWKEINKKYGGTKIKFFEKHTINIVKYQKIVDRYKKLLKRKYWQNGLDFLLLDFAPKFKKDRDYEVFLGLKEQSLQESGKA